MVLTEKRVLDTAMQRGGGKQHIQEIRDGSSGEK